MNTIINHKPALIGIIIALIVALGLGLVIGWALTNKAKTNGSDDNAFQASDGTPLSETVEQVTSDVRVPEAGEQQEGDVAVPNIVTDAAPGVTAKFRKFEMSISQNAFSPREVIARQGDTVRITFTTPSGEYVIVQPDYGFKTKTVTPETSQILEFGATTPGRYTFYCSSCGGPDSGPKGFITVVPNE